MPSATWRKAAARRRFIAERNRIGAARAEPQREHGGEGRHGEEAMVELDRGDGLEPVQPEGLERGIAGRDEASVHQRESVVGEPGIEAGDEAAGEDRQEDQGDDRARRAAQPRRCRAAAAESGTRRPSATHSVAA